jgi:hypothetical protein
MKHLLACAVLLVSSLGWAWENVEPHIFTNIDDRTNLNLDNGTVGWGWCSACAGGQNSIPDLAPPMFHQQPSLDKNGSLELYIASTLPYTNGLWYYELGPYNRHDDFTFDFYVTVDHQASISAQALEFDTFQWINGNAYVFGTQCNYFTQFWEVWNGSAWISTGIACPPLVPGDWYRITWQLQRSDGHVKYNSLAVTHFYHDGRKPKYHLYPVFLSGGTTAEPTPPPDNLGVQFQIDLGPNGGQVPMWVDKVNLTAWP